MRRKGKQNAKANESEVNTRETRNKTGEGQSEKNIKIGNS